MIVHFLPLPNQKSRNGNSKKLLQQSLPAIYGFIVESLSAFCFLYKLCTFHQKSFSKTFSRSFFFFHYSFTLRSREKKSFFPPLRATNFSFHCSRSQNSRNFFSLKRKMEPFFLFEKYKSAILRLLKMYKLFAADSSCCY